VEAPGTGNLCRSGRKGLRSELLMGDLDGKSLGGVALGPSGSVGIETLFRVRSRKGANGRRPRGSPGDVGKKGN